MATYRNSGQSSAAAGTALDATNGALPDAPTLITPGAGGAITIENDATAPGSKAIQTTPASGVMCYWGYTGMTGAANNFAARGMVKVVTLPSVFQGLMSFRSGGGGTPIGSLALDSANHFQAIADVATTSTIASAAITANTWYDVSVQLQNPSTSTGVMVVTVRTAPVGGVEGSTLSTLSVAHGGAIGAGTANFGTSTVGHARAGKTTTAGVLGSVRWKYWSFVTGSSTELGVPGANIPPTVPAIAPKVQSGASATSFTAVPTDADGTVVGHVWTVKDYAGVDVTGVIGATTVTVTVPNQTTAGTYYLTYTATDDFGSTTAVSTYLYVAQSSGSPALPDRVVSNVGGWAYGGTATDLVDALNGWANTIQVTGSPTGGSFTLTVDGSAPTSSIAYNASNATIQAALDALAALPTTTVTGTTVKKIVWNEADDADNDHAVALGTNSLTGGTSPTVAIVNGKYIISGDAPADDSIVLHMQVPATGHYDVRFFVDWVGSDGVTPAAGVAGPFTGQVFQGVTAITAVEAFVNSATGWLECTFALEGAEDTALSTDLTDVRIELTASQAP